MRPLLIPTSTAQPHYLENSVALAILALFDRFPELAGFAVDDRKEGSGEEALAAPLAIGDMRFHVPVRGDKLADIRWGLRDALAELVRERPAALLMLSGRTYNRTLHQLLDTRGLRAQGGQQ